MTLPELSPEDEAAVELELRRRISLAAFVRESWHVLEPSTPLVWNWHIDAICDHVEALLTGWVDAVSTGGVPQVNNLAVTVPPGSLKSRVTSVCAPAWMWLRNPAWRVICLSRNPRVALRDALFARRLIESPWYQTQFQPEWKLSDDQNAKGNYGNDAGGSRQSGGMGAGITGDRGDCVSGSTLVSTEEGDLPMSVVVGMEPPPRVWSFNHTTGAVELRRVVASRVVGLRETVTVKTCGGATVVCTDDHRFHVGCGRYKEAKDIAGMELSVLRWPEHSQERQGDTVRGLRHGDAHVPVWSRVSKGWRGGRQGHQTVQCPTVLLPGVRLPTEPGERRGADERPARHEAVRHLLQAFPDQGEALAGYVFPVMCGDPCIATADETLPHNMRGVWRGGPDAFVTQGLLREGLCERSSLQANDGHGELPSYPVPLPAPPGHAFAPNHPGTGRLEMRGLSFDGQAGDAPCGREPKEQRGGEPDHHVQRVPLVAPSLENDTVSVVERSSTGPQCVYDLQVEGNRNFFAGGVLVHNCLIVDDPLDIKERHSAVAREAVKDAWDTAIRNRVNDPQRSCRVVIMQRVHPEDLVGHIFGKERDAWQHLNLPQEYDPEQHCALWTGWQDPRTQPGELLFPARFTPEVLAEERIILGSADYDAIHQQRPRPREGAIVKLAWLTNRWIERPVVARLWATFDPTAAERPTDWAVLQLWGEGGGRRYLLDQVRGQWSPLGMETACKDALARWRAEWHMEAPLIIERSAAGPAVAERLRSVLPGVVTVVAKDSKEARLQSVVPQLEAGAVWLPDPSMPGFAWVGGLVDELTAFPFGKADDQVDATTHALLWAHQQRAQLRSIADAVVKAGRTVNRFSGFGVGGARRMGAR